jgi:hypothetical protein
LSHIKCWFRKSLLSPGSVNISIVNHRGYFEKYNWEYSTAKSRKRKKKNVKKYISWNWILYHIIYHSMRQKVFETTIFAIRIPIDWFTEAQSASFLRHYTRYIMIMFWGIFHCYILLKRFLYSNCLPNLHTYETYCNAVLECLKK